LVLATHGTGGRHGSITSDRPTVDSNIVISNISATAVDVRRMRSYARTHITIWAKIPGT